VASEQPTISVKQAVAIMFVDAEQAQAAAQAGGCADGRPDKERIRCLLAARFKGDPQAAKLAAALYEQTGSVVGVAPKRIMDGGWRGKIQLVPELPVKRYRRHLKWVSQACRDIDNFFAALATRADQAIGYRHKPLALRYFRSVGRTTPSAYASNWTVSYNVSGSLHSSASAVRETFFHEVFHLNDRDHDNWSERVLSAPFNRIMKQCRVNERGAAASRCLAPYAPGTTMVRGGTFYAFQPGNGVWEYAAELAVRYFREQRTALAAKPRWRPKPFKCGPDPNALTWQALVDEFFGGVDLTGPCK